MSIKNDDAKLEDYYEDINYAQEEDHDIDPPDITEPVAYDQPATYDSDTEGSDNEAEPEFEGGVPHEAEGFCAERAPHEPEGFHSTKTVTLTPAMIVGRTATTRMILMKTIATRAKPAA